MIVRHIRLRQKSTAKFMVNSEVYLATHSLNKYLQAHLCQAFFIHGNINNNHKIHMMPALTELRTAELICLDSLFDLLNFSMIFFERIRPSHFLSSLHTYLEKILSACKFF